MTYAPSNSESPFLSNTQRFNEEEQLPDQLSRMYSNIAYRLNDREIGIYDLVERTTGQKWTDPSNLQVRKETFRKVFSFSATGSIAHNISSLTQVTGYGQYTNGTNFFGVLHSSSVAIAGQVSFYVTPTNLVIISGAGAPAITSGIIVLEYLKN